MTQIRYPTARPFLPRSRSLPVLRRAAQACEGCDLHRLATQAVFGEGPTPAPVMLVGEQPGNDEDLAGRPFVGPAGRMLDRLCEEAGLEREAVYVTNAVKHFKFVAEHRRKRLHQKPSAAELDACRPWLEAELEVVRPMIVVALGASAARTLLGPAFRLTRHHGELVRSVYGIPAVATLHPSAILRMPDSAKRAEARAICIADLALAARFVERFRESGSGFELR